MSESIPKKPHEDPGCGCDGCAEFHPQIVNVWLAGKIIYTKAWYEAKPEISEDGFAELLKATGGKIPFSGHDPK